MRFSTESSFALCCGVVCLLHLIMKASKSVEEGVGEIFHQFMIALIIFHRPGELAIGSIHNVASHSHMQLQKARPQRERQVDVSPAATKLTPTLTARPWDNGVIRSRPRTTVAHQPWRPLADPNQDGPYPPLRKASKPFYDQRRSTTVLGSPIS